MKLISNRDDLAPDMTPGACTHRSMARHLDGDASRWSCMDCGVEVGTDDLGRSLRPLHPLWPLSTVPGAREAFDDQAMQILSDQGAQCGDCGDQPGDRICTDCERCRSWYVQALRKAGWAPRGEIQQQLDTANAELAAIKKQINNLANTTGETR